MKTKAILLMMLCTLFMWPVYLFFGFIYGFMWLSEGSDWACSYLFDGKDRGIHNYIVFTPPKADG